MRSFFRSLAETLSVIGSALIVLFGAAMMVFEPVLYVALAVWLYRHW